MPDMARPLADDMVLNTVGRLLASMSFESASTKARVSRFSAVAIAAMMGSMALGPSATSLCSAFCATGLSGLPLDLTSASSRSER
jgi:hypothetical protein